MKIVYESVTNQPSLRVFVTGNDYRDYHRLST